MKIKLNGIDLMPAIKVYTNEEQDSILERHGQLLIKQKIMQPPFNTYKMGKYILNQFLKSLKEQKHDKASVPPLEVISRLKAIVEATEKGCNTISQEELNNMANLHEIYGKIRGLVQ